jgi:hypothetical protein
VKIIVQIMDIATKILNVYVHLDGKVLIVLLDHVLTNVMEKDYVIEKIQIHPYVNVK